MVGNGRKLLEMVGVSDGGLCGKWWMLGGLEWSVVFGSGWWWLCVVGSGQKLSEMVGVSDGGCVEMVINSCKWWEWGWCVVVGNGRKRLG